MGLLGSDCILGDRRRRGRAVRMKSSPRIAVGGSDEIASARQSTVLSAHFAFSRGFSASIYGAFMFECQYVSVIQVDIYTPHVSS
jgi:hypothetical protein